jgi:hypothetical protein
MVIEDQFFLQSYYLDPRLLSFPHSPVSKLCLRLSLSVCHWPSLLKGMGIGDGRGAKSLKGAQA